MVSVVVVGLWAMDKPRGKAGRPRGYVPANRALMAMRAVFKQPEEKDQGPSQKAMRELMKKDLKGFLHSMRLAEAQHKADQPKKVVESVVVSGEPAPVPEAVVVDIGSDRALELIEELLGEWENGN